MSYQFAEGYNAAYEEIHAAIRSEEHPGQCGDCRACGVMAETAKKVMRTLTDRMTQEEYFTFGLILARIGMAEGRKSG